MFTGIIEECGTVLTIIRNGRTARITIEADCVLEDAQVGDSIAINGVCLTVTDYGRGRFAADVMHETMERSSLRLLECGSHVNLERAMPNNGRFGGHIVTGHVDGTGTIRTIKRDENAIRYTIEARTQLLDGIVEKGSIAVDGISLTVVWVNESAFEVSVIPHTVRVTNLSERKIGDIVNLETDYIGKYVTKWMTANMRKEKGGGMSKSFLAEKGFV